MSYKVSASSAWSLEPGGRQTLKLNSVKLNILKSQYQFGTKPDFEM